MKGVSVRRLLRPLLWLPLIVVLVPLLMLLITPVLLFAWLLGLVPMFSSQAFREDIGITRTGYLAWGVLVPVLVVSLSAPFLALLVGAIVYFLGVMPPELLELPSHVCRKRPAELLSVLCSLSLRFWGWFCVIVGTVGVSANIVYAALDIPWRLKQIRQIRVLPRSRARSAAIGLAEFEGVARLLPPRGESKPAEMRPFLLEDETGQILVDPRGIPLRPRAQTAMTLHLNEVEEGIGEGDRVYVIGNVQRRDDAETPDTPGTDPLVVRPLGQTLVASPLARLLFAPRNQVADRHAPNIFIVEKGGERDVTLRMRLALWEFFVIMSVCLAASLWLVYTAWQWI